MLKLCTVLCVYLLILETAVQQYVDGVQFSIINSHIFGRDRNAWRGIEIAKNGALHISISNTTLSRIDTAIYIDSGCSHVHMESLDIVDVDTGIYLHDMSDMYLTNSAFMDVTNAIHVDAYYQSSCRSSSFVVENTLMSGRPTNGYRAVDQYLYGSRGIPYNLTLRNCTLTHFREAIYTYIAHSSCFHAHLESLNIADVYTGIYTGLRSYNQLCSSSFVVENTIMIGNPTNGYRAVDRHVDGGTESESNWTLSNCTLEYFREAIYIEDTGQKYARVYAQLYNNTFSQNENAIRVNFRGSLTLEMKYNTFKDHKNNVVEITYAIQSTLLAIRDNLFQSNNGTVLRIPNTIGDISVSNNVFLNNIGNNIIYIYELTQLNAAVTSTFIHAFEENVFTNNKPVMTGYRYKEQQCTVTTRVHNAMIHYNIFQNEEFQYELCLAAYGYFDIDDFVDANFNCWNTADSNKIADKIFDQNDWNDRPAVFYKLFEQCDEVFEPLVLTSADNMTLGGRVSEDLILTADNSPYFITSDMTILPNSTLTIEAGTELQFEPNVGILVLGRLESIGHENGPIKFSGTRNCRDYVDGDIRLIDGSEWYGRLEIYQNGVWGSLRSLNYQAATVACKQLGQGPLIGYYQLYQTSLFSAYLYPMWNSNIRCYGSEQKLVDCYRFSLSPCYNCYNYHFERTVVLECSPGNSTAAGFTNNWGGVRIIGDMRSNQNESVLLHVYITCAGHLHNAAAPGLLLSNVSPVVDHLVVQNSTSDGILVDNPKDGLLLQDIDVSRCTSGVVLSNIDHVSVKLERVSSTQNDQYGLKVIPSEAATLDSDNLFGVQPVCIEDTEQITVDKYIELLYQSRNKMCDIVLLPERNETLVVEVLHVRSNRYSIRYCFADIYVYDNATDELLGELNCYHSQYSSNYIRIISTKPGNALRVSSDPTGYDYYNYNNYVNRYDEFYGVDEFDIDLGMVFLIRVKSVAYDGKLLTIYLTKNRFLLIYFIVFFFFFGFVFVFVFFI